jgi:hypothetical protein
MNDVPTPPEPPQQPESTPPPQPPPLPPQPPTASAPPVGAPGQVARQPDKSGKAVASMVLGIVALVSLFCAWLVLALPSLIMGIIAIVLAQMAKKEIAERPGLEGEGQAKAGFIMGIIATAISAITFLILVIALAAS